VLEDTSARSPEAQARIAAGGMLGLPAEVVRLEHYGRLAAMFQSPNLNPLFWSNTDCAGRASRGIAAEECFEDQLREARLVAQLRNDQQSWERARRLRSALAGLIASVASHQPRLATKQNH
jgi:hypothetical protein